MILSHILNSGEDNIFVPDETFEGIKEHFFGHNQTNIHTHVLSSDAESRPLVICGMNETVLHSLIPNSEHFGRLYSATGESLTCLVEKLSEQLDDSDQSDASNGSWINPTTVLAATALTVGAIGAGLYYLHSQKKQGQDSVAMSTNATPEATNTGTVKQKL